jgi:hypothetical protein
MVDGPATGQIEMVRVLHTLRESKRNPKVLTVGGKLIVAALQYEELIDQPSFMLQGADRKTQSRAIKIASFKSRGLHMAESIEPAVKLFQKYVQPRIDSVIHNK